MSQPTPDICEEHPLAPFIPDNARVLMLGSFPPPRNRWAMDFYYPNLQNDMWRIMGIVLHNDMNAFLSENRKGFKLQEIKSALRINGIAIYDTVNIAVRSKGTASDNDLIAVRETDLAQLLDMMPSCGMVVSTGGKSAEICARQFGVQVPTVGSFVDAVFAGRPIKLWRMPSSSRAYPLALAKKAEAYAECFKSILS